MIISQLPEALLIDILGKVESSTAPWAWFFDLRFTSRQFNDLILYLAFRNGPIKRSQIERVRARWHTIDCGTNCWSGSGPFCRPAPGLPYQVQHRYPARWAVQALLCGRGAAKLEDAGRRLFKNLNSALYIVKDLIDPLQWSDEQRRFYKTCCNDPMFSDIHSAIVAEAVFSYIGLDKINTLGTGLHFAYQYYFGIERRSAEFWVALCACNMGDIKLFRAIFNESFSKDSSLDHSRGTKGYVIYLFVAALKGSLEIVRYILMQNPSVLSEYTYGHNPLDAALMHVDLDVLTMLLEATPVGSSTIPQAMGEGRAPYLLHAHDPCEMIAKLLEYDSVISWKAHQNYNNLINQACILDDVEILRTIQKRVPLEPDPEPLSRGNPSTAISVIARYGSRRALEFLLDSGYVKNAGADYNIHLLSWRSAELALNFNHIDVFRELYRRHPWPNNFEIFPLLGMAEGGVEVMNIFMQEHDGILDKRAEYFRDAVPETVTTYGQVALSHSIKRLRKRNVEFLLQQGVRMQPRISWDDFTINYMYWRKNSEAFDQIQVLLKTYDIHALTIRY